MTMQVPDSRSETTPVRTDAVRFSLIAVPNPSEDSQIPPPAALSSV